jgi:hypothetical protein
MFMFIRANTGKVYSEHYDVKQSICESSKGTTARCDRENEIGQNGLPLGFKVGRAALGYSNFDFRRRKWPLLTANLSVLPGLDSLLIYTLSRTADNS